ncbi:MAG: glycosyltransferase [Thioalkalivibrio sp.]|nr:MAG: glycosyltransferase [Thioalkalivibrio sp.]
MPAEPEISVIVPAWNEADELPRTLPVLQRALGELGRAAEIIVVDNDSTDGTADIARAHGAHVVPEPERRIARARNAGAAAARGRFLIFVDADTRPGPELLRASLSLLDSGTVCGGGAPVAFETPDRILYRWGTAFWNVISLRLNLAAGCYVFATREAFEATGGFSEQVYAGEEILFSRRMRRWGRRHGQRFRVLREPRVQTSARKAEWFSLSQHLALLALLTVFPFALRSRRLCGFWYRRPGAGSNDARSGGT